MSSQNLQKYFITFHNPTDGQLLTDMDYRDPLKVVEKVEQAANLQQDIVPMADNDVKDYIRVMNYNVDDIEDDEYTSVYVLHIKQSLDRKPEKLEYTVNHDEQTYLVKFHPLHI